MFRSVEMAVAEADLVRERARTAAIPITDDIPLDQLPMYVEPRRLVMRAIDLCDVCERSFPKVYEYQIQHLFGYLVCKHPNCNTVCENSFKTYAQLNNQYFPHHEPYKTIFSTLPKEVRFYRARINGVQNGTLTSMSPATYMVGEKGQKAVHLRVEFSVRDGTMTHVYERGVPLRNLLQHNVTIEQLAELQKLEGLDEYLRAELEFEL